jgi:hypothetical protein
MALTVEDGSALADADSFAELTFIDAYLAARGKTTWAALSESVRELHARNACDYMEQVYGLQYIGTRYSKAQGRAWPRTGAYLYGELVLDDEIPILLQQVQAELAYRSSTLSGGLLPDIETGAGGVVKRTRSKVGPLEEEIEYTEGTSVAYPTFPAVTAMIAPLLKRGGAKRVFR